MICSRSTVRKKRTRGAVSRITNNKSDAKNQHFGTDVNAASECVVSERASERDRLCGDDRETDKETRMRCVCSRVRMRQWKPESYIDDWESSDTKYWSCYNEVL